MPVLSGPRRSLVSGHRLQERTPEEPDQLRVNSLALVAVTSVTRLEKLKSVSHGLKGRLHSSR